MSRRRHHPADRDSTPRVAPTERLSADLRRLLAEREFESLEQANAFLQDALRTGRLEHHPPPASPLEQAQDLMYDAWEEPDAVRRVALARQALELSPDCADAYVLLAEETAESLAEAAALYAQGVAAGELAHGPERFAAEAGHFWGIVETRPYMRARLGLAMAQWRLGRQDDALAHYRKLLRLNDNDNQGVRYILAAALGALGHDEELAALLDDPRFAEDGMAAWLYTRALLAWRREGDTPAARDRLAQARRANAHVPDYLLEKKRLPHPLPELISVGDEDEAVSYAAEFSAAWRRNPGALAWLRSRTTAVRTGKRR